jgi:hypothetical protein
MTAATLAGGKLLVGATVLGGGMAFLGALKGAINIGRFAGEASRLKQSTDDLKRARWINENNPALNNDNVNQMLAKLRQDLATLRQLHANLGRSGSGTAGGSADAEAKVAQLEAMANQDATDIQRSCKSLDFLGKELKGSATLVARGAQAARRILADPGEWPQSKNSLSAAFDQMKNAADAASAARRNGQEVNDN